MKYSANNKTDLNANTRLKKSRPQKKPQFPLLIFLVALFKDIIDVPGEISIVGMIITAITSFLLAAILFCWSLLKAQTSGLNKNLSNDNFTKYIWQKYVLLTLVELIPFVKIIPGAITFVLMVYNKEMKNYKKSRQKKYT